MVHASGPWRTTGHWWSEPCRYALDHFDIQGEYIELIKLLKAANLVMSGGEAKRVVAEGLVTVDGAIETRKRNKIRPGQIVRFEGETIHVGPAPA